MCGTKNDLTKCSALLSYNGEQNQLNFNLLQQYKFYFYINASEITCNHITLNGDITLHHLTCNCNTIRTC